MNHQDVLGIQRDALVEVGYDVPAHRHSEYGAADGRQRQPDYKYDD